MTRRKPGPTDYAEHYASNARRMLQHLVDRSGSQDCAASMLGVSQSRISKILRGSEQPKLSLLIELRTQLQVPLDVILGLPLLDAEKELLYLEDVRTPPGVQPLLAAREKRR